MPATMKTQKGVDCFFGHSRLLPLTGCRFRFALFVHPIKDSRDMNLDYSGERNQASRYILLCTELAELHIVGKSTSKSTAPSRGRPAAIRQPRQLRRPCERCGCASQDTFMTTGLFRNHGTIVVVRCLDLSREWHVMMGM